MRFLLLLLSGVFDCGLCIVSSPLFRDPENWPYIEFELNNETVPIFIRFQAPPPTRAGSSVLRILPFSGSDGVDHQIITPLTSSAGGQMYISIEWMLQSIDSSVNFVGDQLLLGVPESEFLRSCMDTSAIRLPRTPTSLMGRVGVRDPTSDVGSIHYSEPHNPPYINPDLFDSIERVLRSVGVTEIRRNRGAARFFNCTREAVDESFLSYEFFDSHLGLNGRILSPLPFKFDQATNTCTLRFRSNAPTTDIIASFSPLNIPDTNVRITASYLSICDRI